MKIDEKNKRHCPAPYALTWLDEPSPEYYEKARALLKADEEKEKRVTE